jgi:dipeptidyl aminopeptidase/acylaminoacyl peptidase
MTKKVFFTILLIVFGVIGISGGIFLGFKLKNRNWGLLSPLGSKVEEKEKPLVRYELERVKKRQPQSSQIVLDRLLAQTDDFTSYLFFYESEGKKISGLANIPLGKGPFPVIVMLRGWVDPAMYQTGVGTSRAGGILAQNGYLTLAPDFLGYGESEMPPNDVWEERFLKNINIADLLAAIDQGNIVLNNELMAKMDPQRVGIWGHSNGGLSALTALELSAKAYPTTLWAPVTRFFPYDVLYYTFEADDKGKALRKNLADFEKDYETDKYSFDEYLDWINKETVIQLHQGTADAYIPLSWSDNMVADLTDLGIKVNYFKYSGAGHNMEGSWDLVVQRDLQFFNQYFTSK